jgi:hypothetical protein
MMTFAWPVILLLTVAIALCATYRRSREPFQEQKEPMEEVKESMAGRSYKNGAAGGPDVPFEDTDVFATFFAQGTAPLLVAAKAPLGTTARSVVVNDAHAAADALVHDLESRVARAPDGFAVGLHMADRGVSELANGVFATRLPTDSGKDVVVLELQPKIDGDSAYALFQRLLVATQVACSATLAATVDRLVGRVRVAEDAAKAAEERAQGAQRATDSASAAARYANKSLAAENQCYEFAMQVVAQEADGRGATAAQLRTTMADRGCSRIPGPPPGRS